MPETVTSVVEQRVRLMRSLLPESVDWFALGVPVADVLALYPLSVPVVHERLLRSVEGDGSRDLAAAVELMGWVETGWRKHALSRRRMVRIVAARGPREPRLLRRAIHSEGRPVVSGGDGYRNLSELMQLLTVLLLEPEKASQNFRDHNEETLPLLVRSVDFWVEFVERAQAGRGLDPTCTVCASWDAEQFRVC